MTETQTKQQFFGQSAPIVTMNLFETNRYIMEKLNLPSKLSATDDQMKKTLAEGAQQQQAATGAQPSTTAGQVSFPQDRGVTI